MAARGPEGSGHQRKGETSLQPVQRRFGTAFAWVACLAVFAAPALAVGTSQAATSAAVPKQSFAVVDSDGTLVRGSPDVLSSSNVGTGKYEVITDHDVSDCAYVADPGEPGNGGSIGAPAFTVTALRSTTTAGVWVHSFDGTGADVNLPFHLHIDCNPKGYWAVVNADGSVSRGSNKVAGATHPGTGVYDVDFNKKVNKCAYTANVGNPTDGDPFPLTVGLAGRTGDKFGVAVEVQDTSGTPTDASFHLDVACGAKALDAVVDSTGAFVRGAKGAASIHLTTGAYEVDFDRDVSGCGFVASVAQPGSSGFPAQGTATVAGRAGNPDGVFVQTFDLTGTQADRPFHLILYC